MMYLVEKSIAGNESAIIAEYDSFDEAVTAAEAAGATGEPRKQGRKDWCFTGGKESIGYWISEA